MLIYSEKLDYFTQNNDGYRKLNSNTFYISNVTYDIEPNSINYVDTSEGEIRLSINYLLLKPSDIIIVVDIGNNLHSEKVTILNLKRLNNTIVADFDLTTSTSIYRFYYISEEYGWAYENIILNSLYGNLNIRVNWNDIYNKPTSILNTNILDVYTKSQTDSKITWENLVNKPTTIVNYNITDAYTKTEIDNLLNDKLSTVTWNIITNKPTTIANYSITDAYTKTEIDELLSSISGGGTTVYWSTILNKPTTIASYNIVDAYTKTEIDELLSSISGGGNSIVSWTSITNKPTTIAGYNITDAVSQSMLNNYSLSTHTHTFASISEKPNTIAGYGITNVYTISEIDLLIANITSPGNGTTVYWSTILNKPTTIAGYNITDAVSQSMLNNYSLSTHTHTFASISNKPTTISGYGITDAISTSVLSQYSLSTHTHTFASISNKPTTISGYGITDAISTSVLSQYSLSTHTHTWISLTSKPTTVSGFGITDVYTKSQTDSAITSALIPKLNITSYNAEDILLKIKTVDGPNSGLNADLLDGIQGNEYQLALGFTPIQQGGGIGQLTNKIKIGWNGTKLKATVDNIDLGEFVFFN